MNIFLGFISWGYFLGGLFDINNEQVSSKKIFTIFHINPKTSKKLILNENTLWKNYLRKSWDWKNILLRKMALPCSLLHWKCVWNYTANIYSQFTVFGYVTFPTVIWQWLSQPMAVPITLHDIEEYSLRLIAHFGL